MIYYPILGNLLIMRQMNQTELFYTPPDSNSIQNPVPQNSLSSQSSVPANLPKMLGSDQQPSAPKVDEPCPQTSDLSDKDELSKTCPHHTHHNLLEHSNIHETTEDQGKSWWTKANKITGLTQFFNVQQRTNQPSNYKISLTTLEFPIPQQKKHTIPQIEEEEDCKLYKNRSWTRTKLAVQTNKLSFFEFTFQISELSKIKILPISPSKSKNENSIKLDIKNQVVLFSLKLGKKKLDLPLVYYIFAKIIDKKISLLGYYPSPETSYNEPTLPQAINDSYIYGKIMKRSQSLGKWEERFVVIKKSGIFSYRNCIIQSYSFHISSESIKYLWTRFDFVSNLIIVKVKHGIAKTQFGIPIITFSSRSPRNWLYNFYRVLPNPAGIP